MSKIVCDVCGSTFSETEVQCPICGTAKSDAAKSVVETTGDNQNNNAGKFSKNTSRKTGIGSDSKKSGTEKDNAGKEQGTPSNLAMIIIVGILLLAIVAVCVFIAVRLFDRPVEPDPSTTESTAPTILQIPCTGLELADIAGNSISFTAITDSVQLNVKPQPENTTDDVILTYSSSNPAVAVVSNTGLVTPVASGSATITVSYGSFSVTVDVTCNIPVPVTELTLTKSEITLSPTNGLTAQLYNGDLDPADITWTSSDEAVAHVENGMVTAVANGKATITATYGDLTATCKIIVKNMNQETAYVLACTWGTKSDATMVVGDSIEIFLINKETGEQVKELHWNTSNDFPKCCTIEITEKGIRVTATEVTTNVSGQYVYVQTEYEGQQYRFVIRIKAAETQE